MHRLVVQGWSHAFMPHLSSSNTIQSRKEGKCCDKILPVQKPFVCIGHNPHADAQVDKWTSRCESIMNYDPGLQVHPVQAVIASCQVDGNE